MEKKYYRRLEAAELIGISSERLDRELRKDKELQKLKRKDTQLKYPIELIKKLKLKINGYE